MELVEFKWEQLGPVCDMLYNNNPYLSPYQEYSFLNVIRKSANIHNVIEWMVGRNITYVAKKYGEIVCVLPLVINKRKKEINLLGYLCSVGHLDFIYRKDLTLEDFKEIIEQLHMLYKGYTLHLERISQFSLTYEYLKEMNVMPESQSICVKIDFDTYENWFSSLSKSCRQNVRTAYNRINRENKSLDVQIKIGESPSKSMILDNIDLLSKRTIEHNKKSNAFYPLMKLLKSKEGLTKALFSTRHFIGANIYLDGLVVAICNGVIANDGRAIITRLSIDTNYGVYCPGGLIINELIKACVNSNMGITSIDLSRGSEKYKYTYGGHEHYNYDFKIVTN